MIATQPSSSGRSPRPFSNSASAQRPLLALPYFAPSFEGSLEPRVILRPRICVNSKPLNLLRTLCRCEETQPLWNQANPHSFRKTPGWGYPNTSALSFSSIVIYATRRLYPLRTRSIAHTSRHHRGVHLWPLARHWISSDYAECARKSCVRRSAMILSSPGCSMNEFIPRPLSFLARTMDGLPLRNCCAASRTSSEMWRGSQ